MSELQVKKLDNSDGGKFTVETAIADAPFKPFVIKDAVVYHQARMRQGTHATKTRSMVAGSTRKLYRQKGTGNARVGNNKAVQRRGGGVVHGPVVRSHDFDLNKKVRKLALRSALAEQIREGKLVLMDSLEPATGKTKALAAQLDGFKARTLLLVTDEISENLELASRNLPNVAVIHHRQLNTYNLLRFEKTLITTAAMEAVQKRLIG